jgi:hypothetical protein
MQSDECSMMKIALMNARECTQVGDPQSFILNPPSFGELVEVSP